MTVKRLLLLLLLAIPGWIGWLMWQIGSFIPPTSPGVDTAIVLGAAVHDGKPSPVFRERINHAVNLYREEKIRKIIFTGGIGLNDKLAESEVGKRYAISKGVKGRDIMIEKLSHNTHDNLLQACRVMQRNNIKSVVIISDPLHLKRSIEIARDSGMEAYGSATPTTRYQTWKSKSRFLIYETYYYIGHLWRRYFGSLPKCSAPA